VDPDSVLTSTESATTEYSPFFEERVYGQGLISELITTALKESGDSVKWRFLPFDRARFTWQQEGRGEPEASMLKRPLTNGVFLNSEHEIIQRQLAFLFP